MLSKIIEFSVRNKLIVGLFIIALVGYGIYQTTLLPIDAVPDITNNQVQIITVAPALGATDIERLITFPIEQANNNIAGLLEIRSFSRFGLSLVTIVFDDATDIYWARQQVSERLQVARSNIPAGVGIPELGPISSGLGEIYQYVVRPKKGYEHKYDAMQLRTIQDWIVRRQLLGVKGVAEVSSFGGKLKQYEVAINTDKLNAHRLTIDDVFKALADNNQNTGGAYIERGPTVLFIRSEGLIGSLKNIEDIAVKNNSEGTPVFIRDVAEVKIGYATRYGAMCYNDQGEVSGAVVMMLKGANSSEVIKGVKERIEQIRKTLPEGVEIEPFLDRTKMVNNAIGTVEHNLMEGALIVILVLVFFLGNLRAGLLVASVIPLAMLFAICLMNFFGVSGNLMSLGALDFGLIVDGAVIIVEAVMHQLIHHRKYNQIVTISNTQMDEEVNRSAGKMMNSAVFGQIIILIVYLPIFTLEGIEGKMFKPMAQTVSFALLGAFILSLTYIPMMSALFLSKRIKPGPNFSDKMIVLLERKYRKALAYVLRYPKIAITIVIALFGIAVFILSGLGGEFIPALEEGDFAVDTRVLTGSSINTTIEYTQKAAHILKARFPEVKMVVTKIGSGEVPTDPMPMEASDMMVILKDKKEWTSAKTFDELSEKMSAALQDVPGITASFQFPVQMRFNELMTGARQDVVCKIYGEDLDSLALTASKLGRIVNNIKGTGNLYVEAVTGMPEIIIDYNPALIAQYQLSIADINRAVNTAFAGQSAGLVFEGEKRFDLVVRLDEKHKANLDDVKNLLIPTPGGKQIPLAQLAHIAIKIGPNQIQREDAKRRIIVGFNVHGRDVQSIVKELQSKVEAQLKLPTGYYVVYGGSFENLTKAKSRLMIAVPVSLILIFIILFFAFGSVKHGLLIYTAIPLSAIGGIFLLAARGMPFSISAGIGFIALFGVAVLNGIVLIAEFNRLKASGMQSLSRIVIVGSQLRLRPVLMTAFVASLGFLPMALSNGAGAEVQRPLATVVIGGLMIATFLTLFILPVLYVVFERKVFRWKSAPKVIAVALLLFSFNQNTKAQTMVSLDSAWSIGLKNNLYLKAAHYNTNAANAAVATAASIPNTILSSDLGQINSAYFDSKFAVTQSFNFPTIYIRQKEQLNLQWQAAQINEKVKEADIKMTISQAFYEYLYVAAKEDLLESMDSLYSNILDKAVLRLQKGESNLLEKVTFQAKKNELSIQLNQLEQQKALLLIRFNQVLHSDSLLIPQQFVLKYEAVRLTDSSQIMAHPVMQQWRMQERIAVSSLAVEKARLLPDFILGYSNSSIKGMGADDKIYLGSQRFQSIQAGISLPLFFRSQKAKIKVGKWNVDQASSLYEAAANDLKSQYQVLLFQNKKQNELIHQLELLSLPDEVVIKTTALAQFASGEINYMDFVLLIAQAIQIRTNYLDAVKAWNENCIQLIYYSSK